MENKIIIMNLSDERFKEIMEIASGRKYSESERADLLLKYKNLLDFGAITKDEFEDKKQKLLNV